MYTQLHNTYSTHIIKSHCTQYMQLTVYTKGTGHAHYFKELYTHTTVVYVHTRGNVDIMYTHHS